MQFTVVNQYANIDVNSIWTITFPRYYTPQMWNQNYLIYCLINSSPIICQRSLYTPYQIVLTSSALIIPTGSTYTISIYGIPCPRMTYVTGSSTYLTEGIFFAMSTSTTSTSYAEYS